MTTEGDGNYQLQRFLEKEGAEADIQFVTAWILYNLWEVRFDTASRADLRGIDTAKYGLGGTGEYGVFQRKIGLWAGDIGAARARSRRSRYAGGLYGYHLPDMDAVAEVAAPYYNNDLRGGEGHMEVGKLILNVVKSKAHMTLSVKPFGCMPSSGVSDGVQSLITEKFPGTIFCAVETSGDGARQLLLPRADVPVQGAAGGPGRVRKGARRHRPDRREAEELPRRQPALRFAACTSRVTTRPRPRPISCTRWPRCTANRATS